jgi:hypothetical protein
MADDHVAVGGFSSAVIATMRLTPCPQPRTLGHSPENIEKETSCPSTSATARKDY